MSVIVYVKHTSSTIKIRKLEIKEIYLNMKVPLKTQYDKYLLFIDFNAEMHTGTRHRFHVQVFLLSGWGQLRSIEACSATWRQGSSCSCVCWRVQAMACVWRSEESLMERILFFTFMWILGLALELRLSELHSSTELSHWPAYFNLRNMFYPYIKTTH